MLLRNEINIMSSACLYMLVTLIASTPWLRVFFACSRRIMKGRPYYITMSELSSKATRSHIPRLWHTELVVQP